MKLLKLEKETMLHIVKAFVENGIAFLPRLSGIQYDGIAVYLYGNRLQLFFAVRCGQHFTSSKEKDAGCTRTLIQRQIYDIQP